MSHLLSIAPAHIVQGCQVAPIPCLHPAPLTRTPQHQPAGDGHHQQDGVLHCLYSDLDQGSKDYSLIYLLSSRMNQLLCECLAHLL